MFGTIIAHIKQYFVDSCLRMLLKIDFENCYSFLEPTSVSFLVGKKVSNSFWETEINGRRVNKAIGVLGANASGKTNLLRAIDFLSKFIPVTYEEKKPNESIPITRHLLGSETSKISALFVLSEVEYKYKVECTNSSVIEESLHKKGDTGKFKYVFKRTKLSDGKFAVKQNKFGFDSNKAVHVPDNLSFIGAANSFGVPLAKEISNYMLKIKSNMHSLGRHSKDFRQLMKSSRFFDENPVYLDTLAEIMRNCDFGIDRISFSKIVKGDAGKDTGDRIAMGHHKCGEKEFRLPFMSESNGTQSAFLLLNTILPILKNGGTAVIDEIDNDLHPHLLPHILDLFKHEETNPNNAQIIFTCHTPEILNILAKHQIYLTEKDESSSASWRLADLKGIRSDDNRYAKYMAGALGAVPYL